MPCIIQIIEKRQMLGQVEQYEPWQYFPESTPYRTMQTFRFPTQLTWVGNKGAFSYGMI